MSDVRLIYLDDSGARDTGLVVFSWCEVAVTDWERGLRAWLDWRAALTELHGIPKNYELHATKFVNGRGAPSVAADWNRHKAHRWAVMADAMTLLAEQDWLSIGTVFTRVDDCRHYGTERQRAYVETVAMLDRRLRAADEFGIVVMDGDGTDESYLAAHRQLPLAGRRLIEDPSFQHSHRSQWIQMADLVAYAAYQHILGHPGKRFAWPWYRQLAPRDALTGPQRV